MASRMDWIMSFIRCATLIAPSTLKAVEASCAAASRAGPGAATGPARRRRRDSGQRSCLGGRESEKAGLRKRDVDGEAGRPCGTAGLCLPV